GAVVLNAVNGTASTGTVTLNLDGTNAGNAINGAITDGIAGGKLAISKTNSSTWTLNSANNYTGGTSIGGGTLVAAAANALPTGQNITNNGTLIASANQSIGNINGTGTLSIGSAATIQLGASSGASSENALSIATGGMLNINNDHMFINYGTGPD